MKVDYLFSHRPKSVLSKMIAWASKMEVSDLDQCPSHMAVLLNDSIVIESTLTSGVHMIPLEHWQIKNVELYRIPCTKEYRNSKEVLDTAFSKWGKKYDWMGILFFAWRFLGLIVFKRQMPGKNHWQNKNKYFCCEYAGTLTGEDFSMKTPARICSKWLRSVK